MHPSVRQLIETASDYDQVMGICHCIGEKRRMLGDLPRSSLPKEQEAIGLIIFAIGVLGNGGFMYFEELEGDVEATAKALELVGAHSAAEHMRDWYEEGLEIERDAIDSNMADFIRANPEAYDDLPAYVPD